MAASAAFTPSTEPWITVETPAKKALPFALMKSMADSTAGPSGILCAVTQASKPRAARAAVGACGLRSPAAPVSRRTS